MKAFKALLELGLAALLRSRPARRGFYAALGMTLAVATVFTVSRVLAGDLLGGDGQFDSAGQWSGWTGTNSQGGVTISRDTVDPQAGTASARLSGTVNAFQNGTLAGDVAHTFQVSKATDSLQLKAYYRKDIAGTPSSTRIYWELWGSNSAPMTSGDLDTAAGTASWSAEHLIGLSGLRLQPGAPYTLRLGFSVTYGGLSFPSRTASVWFDGLSLLQDTEAPTVVLVDPSPASGSYQGDTSLTFSWQGRDIADVTPADQLEYQYSTDGGATWSAWAAAQKQATVTYREGPARSFAVRARDRAGNVGQPEQLTFTVDVTPPVVTIQSGLGNGGTSNAATQTFAWSGNDALSPAETLQFEYSVDGGANWAAVGKALEVTVTYGEGTAHTFDVRALDAAGNKGSSDRRTFAIDLTPPEVLQLSGPTSGQHLNSPSHTFTWTGADSPAPGAALTYQYAVNQGAWSDPGPGTSAAVTFPEGAARFDVRAIDPAGNVGRPLTISFTVDLTPPAIANTTATPDITRAVLSFDTAGDPSTARVRYGTVPGSPDATAVEAGPAESHSINLTGLKPNFTYYYTIEANDRAGNITLQPEASFGTLPDHVPPDTAIAAAPAEGSWKNAPSLTFQFAGTDNVTAPGTLRYSYSVDGGRTWTELSSSASVTAASYPEGVNQSFQVRAADEAGNLDPTPAQRFFHVDRTPPGVSLAAGPADGSFVTTTAPLFSWSGTDAMTDAPSLQYATSVDGGRTWGAWGSANTAQPTYAEGRNRQFAVKTRDLAGNESAVLQRSFQVDVTAPTVTMTDGPADGAVTNVRSQTFAWSGSDNLTAVNALQYAASTDGGATWSAWSNAAQATLDLTDGKDLTFQVRSRDEAGHVSAPAARHFIVDTVPPVPDGVSLAVRATHADISWTTAGDPSTAVVRYGAKPAAYDSAMTDSQRREAHTLTLSGLRPGLTYYYLIESTDQAGNVATTAEASFSTPASIPHVIATVPDAGDPNAGTSSRVKAYFDVDLDAATITGASFRVTNAADGLPLEATSVAYDAGSRSAVLIPAANLAPNTGFTAALTTTVKSADGQPLEKDYVWSFTTGASAFPSPHGNFSTNNAACKSCHNTHSSPAAALLSRADVTSLCFTCHDGTGSSLDVKGQFARAADGGAMHPVRNLPVSTEGILNCTDCHNPHGDKQPDGSLYPRLLRVVQGDGSYTFGGNNVCFSCHGAVDLGWSVSYWSDSGGDHTNSTAAHYQDYSALVPPSGTGITCISCHQDHASPTSGLLQEAQPEVCLKCHENTANSQSLRNVRDEFSGASVASRHDVFNTTGGALSCSSCHGPHAVARGRFDNGDGRTELTDPRNTKQDMSQSTTGATAAQRYTDFCLTCHSGVRPARTTTAAAVVPLTILFPDRSVTTNGGGGVPPATPQSTWDKSVYTGSAHYQAGVGCNDCHTSHGSPYDLLQTRPEDTETSGTSGICGKCHSGSPPAPFSTAPNVWPDLTGTDDAHRHPTLTVAGLHQDTEDLSSQGRHAECTDCHDPHAATQSSPAINVSGVEPSWGPAWGTPVYTLRNPATALYQACLKCHSSYAFGATPPATTGGIPATDVAQEINPNNASYHSEVAPSRIPTFTEDGGSYPYGLFTGGWTAADSVGCADCHGSSGGLRGPHGSANAGILRRPFNPVNGSSGTGTPGTQGDLCFTCHDYGFYADGADTGSATVRSQFSGAGSSNLHALSEHRQRGCTACHVAVPHGWTSQGLIADIQANPARPEPYFAGSKLRVYNWAEPGQWQESDCGGCHDDNL